MSNKPTFNLQKELRNYFPVDLVTIGAIALGEKENNLSKLIRAAIPTVLISFIRKVSCTTSAEGLLFLALAARNNSELKVRTDYYAPAGSIVHDYGSDLLSELMDIKLKPVIQIIARHAFTKIVTTQTLLEYVCCIAMQSIGEYAKENNFDAKDLQNWLISQEADIIAALPGDLLSIAVSFNSHSSSNGSPHKTGVNKKAQKEYLFGRKITSGFVILFSLFLVLIIVWLFVLLH